MASSYTYPIARPTGTLTTAQLHLLLSNPNVVAKRVAQLTNYKFIADFLLTGKYTAQGGGLFYQTGESIFATDPAEAIEVGGEYPLTILSSGDVAAAKTDKWGLGTEIFDEKLSREGQSYMDKGFGRLGNTVVKTVDSVAMAVIASKVTDTFAATGAWSSVANIIATVLAARANRDNLALGLDLDTIALTGAQYATVMGVFINANVLPREQGNPIVAGQLPVNLMGFTWVTSPWIVGSNPLLVDRDQLGGMADENIGSPEFRSAPQSSVEAATDRLVGVDGYRLRARRVTTAVVTEPHAGLQLTGTGL
jgi:hypothetical protein